MTVKSARCHEARVVTMDLPIPVKDQGSEYGIFDGGNPALYVHKPSSILSPMADLFTDINPVRSSLPGDPAILQAAIQIAKFSRP